MDDIVELGGNITLSGFSEVDGGSMIIVKKIVGQYAKAFSEKNNKYEKLAVTLNRTRDNRVTSEATIAGEIIKGEVTEKNLFTALDKSLKEVKI